MAPITEVHRPWDLAVTGWAVIFAPDVDRRVKLALRELLEHRRQAASYFHSEYYRELTYNGESVHEFLWKHGARAGVADPDRFPYYVLLVGSPETLPYNFQAELDGHYAVGRIYFQEHEDYANYAHGIVQAEDRPRPLPRTQQVVFFATEHENDPATQRTSRDLLQPLAKSLLEPGMHWEVREVCGTEARKERLRTLLGGAETPALLFAACHGLGFDEADDRQEACQGALVCQDWLGPDEGESISEDEWFAASDVPEEASLRGLVAFLYASYAVGTPNREDMLGKTKSSVSRTLISRLPQRLLSHRAGGALAVIGHVGRAWMPSLSGLSRIETINPFRNAIRRLLRGHTVGWAMEYLNQPYLAFATENFVERAGEEVDEKLTAYLNLMRQDARNIMVFGDPAVCLLGVRPP